MYVQVALNVPLRQVYTWSVPERLRHGIERGRRVLVPFRSDVLPGVILEVSDTLPEHATGKRMRAIVDVLDATRFVPEPQLELCTWIARYYHAPVGECVHLAVPGSLTPRRGRATWTLTQSGEASRAPSAPALAPTTHAPTPTPDPLPKDATLTAIHGQGLRIDDPRTTAGDDGGQRNPAAIHDQGLRIDDRRTTAGDDGSQRIPAAIHDQGLRIDDRLHLVGGQTGEAGGGASGSAHPICAALAEHGAMTTDELRKLVPDLTLMMLDELEQLGMIRVAEPDGASGGPKTDLLLCRTDATPDHRPGERQRLIIDFLEQHGESSWDELRELYGLQRGQVRALERAGWLTTREVPVWRDPFRGQRVEPRAEDPALTDEQAAAVGEILRAHGTPAQRPWLLHGVTGSGKTEVYVRLIRHVRALGRRALILLPEIALTPQFTGVMRAALGEEIAVMHSGLTPAERRDQWLQIRRGSIGVVIGARSALFAPIDDLGLIVVDEEHDPSFKQNEGVRYHARDAAVMLAAATGATVVLGSATPSLESLNNARRGRYGLARLARRVQGRPMPTIELVDLRDQPPARGDREQPDTPISVLLEQAVRQTVDAGEQVILFLNRRGYAPAMACGDCGESLQCTACEVSLTYHHRGRVMRCHYCGFSAPVPRTCPTCGSDELTSTGAGTERIEEHVVQTFADLRVGRLDRDSARGQGLQQTLQAFRRHELDVLVGTQMVTKGHDFPNVTLVGVLDGDQSLRFPDFRGGERTYQLLTQVAGRAGRGDRPGHVIIQTWKPEHHVLRAVRDGDFDGFAEAELRLRSRQGYPPFGFAALVRLNSADQVALTQAGAQLRELLTRPTSPRVHVLGPTDAPIPRVRERYRTQILLRSSERTPLHQAAALVTAFAESLRATDVRVSTDIDAQSML